MQKLETRLKVQQSWVALPRLFAEYQVAQSQDTEGNDIHILWNEHLMSTCTCTGTLQFHASLVLHYIYIHINCHDWILSHLWNALLCGGAEVQCSKASTFGSKYAQRLVPTRHEQLLHTFAYFCTMPDHAKDFSSWLASWSKPFHLHPWGDYSPSASLQHVPTMC